MSVSVIGMGCNQLGVTCDADGARLLVDEAVDAGITYFDVADEYGRRYWDMTDPAWGVAEEHLGRALRGKRDRVLVATKFGVRPPTRLHLGGASPEWIATAIDDSLRRLDTDYVDVYQLHLPDPTVPIAETLVALDTLVRMGKVRAIGCSNLQADQLVEADRVASELGTAHFVSNQGRLNLFSREALVDIMPTCEQLEMKFIPYYPLARGVLTGKYGRNEPVPPDTRLSLYDVVDVPVSVASATPWLVAQGGGTQLHTRLPVKASQKTREQALTAQTFDRLEALASYAAAHGHSLLELAFGWLLAFPAVSTVIAGVARPGQATANANATGWAFTRDEFDEVTALAAR
jgi:aryl-alcohol dehydrogenase-like predicted oxidoreductase